jgi:hypothetical protein
MYTQTSARAQLSNWDTDITSLKLKALENWKNWTDACYFLHSVLLAIALLPNDLAAGNYL